MKSLKTLLFIALITASFSKLVMSYADEAVPLDNEVLELISKTQSPRAEMIQRLSTGENVLTLFIAFGPRDKLRPLETETFNLAANENFRHFLSDYEKEQSLSEILVEINSLDKFKNFLQYSRSLAPEVKLFFLPVERVVLRNYIQIYFKNAMRQDSPPLKFWIGDSQVAQKPESLRAYNDIEEVYPYMKACEKLDVPCLSSLIESSYFKGLSWIDSKPQDPLIFFKRKLSEAVAKQEGGLNAIKTFLDPEIIEVKLLTDLWAVFRDSNDLQDLVMVHNSIGENIAERLNSSDETMYLTPMRFYSTISKVTEDKKINTNLALRQFYEYVCTLTPCLRDRP